MSSVTKTSGSVPSVRVESLFRSGLDALAVLAGLTFGAACSAKLILRDLLSAAKNLRSEDGRRTLLYGTGARKSGGSSGAEPTTVQEALAASEPIEKLAVGVAVPPKGLDKVLASPPGQEAATKEQAPPAAASSPSPAKPSAAAASPARRGSPTRKPAQAAPRPLQPAVLQPTPEPGQAPPSSPIAAGPSTNTTTSTRPTPAAKGPISRVQGSGSDGSSDSRVSTVSVVSAASTSAASTSTPEAAAASSFGQQQPQVKHSKKYLKKLRRALRGAGAS